MSESPILVTGAAGGRRQGPSAQGSTGFHVTRLLLERGEPVRALVHRFDERSDELRALGAEVVVGDLLELPSVRAAVDGVTRGYVTYRLQDGIWTREMSDTPTQPLNGFTVAAYEDETELESLCQTWETADSDPSLEKLLR